MSAVKKFSIAFSAALVTAGSALAEAVSDALPEHGVEEMVDPTTGEATAIVPEPSVDAATSTASATAEAAGHHGGSGLPQFNVETWPSQIFWLAVAFAVLYVIFSKSMLPAISATLANRKNHIDSRIAEAETITYQAKNIEDQVALAMKSAARKAADEMHTAENQAKERLSKALTDFRSRYEQEISSAEARIQDSKAEAMEDMQRVVADLAAQMARKVAGLSTDASQVESVLKSLNEKKRKAA